MEDMCPPCDHSRYRNVCEHWSVKTIFCLYNLVIVQQDKNYKGCTVTVLSSCLTAVSLHTRGFNLQSCSQLESSQYEWTTQPRVYMYSSQQLAQSLAAHKRLVTFRLAHNWSLANTNGTPSQGLFTILVFMFIFLFLINSNSNCVVHLFVCDCIVYSII